MRVTKKPSGRVIFFCCKSCKKNFCCKSCNFFFAVNACNKKTVRSCNFFFAVSRVSRLTQLTRPDGFFYAHLQRKKKLHESQHTHGGTHGWILWLRSVLLSLRPVHLHPLPSLCLHLLLSLFVLRLCAILLRMLRFICRPKMGRGRGCSRTWRQRPSPLLRPAGRVVVRGQSKWGQEAFQGMAQCRSE